MRESRFRAGGAWITLLVFVFLAWLTPASAQSRITRLGGGAENSVAVPLYKSRIIGLNAPAARISVGSPDIADILILQSTQLYVLGKDIGTTNILLWDRDDVLIGTLNVEVTHDLQSLKEKLFRLMPEEKIEVYSAQRNIVLAGNVSNISRMDAALKVARGYFTQIAAAVESDTFELQEGGSTREDKSVGEVINLMSVGGVHQVMLEVKVAEIKRTELKRLDVRFNSIFTGSSGWTWGATNGGINAGNPLTTIPTVDDTGLFGRYLSDNAILTLAIDAATNNGLAKILAEPTLVTMSGHEAKFVSGGEFGYTVQGGVNGNTVDFKEFGILVGFLPLVLDSGRISLKLDISISELSGATVLGVPSLVKRGATSTVELADGQTIGLAGLIDEKLSDEVWKFPGLGSLPILGALFRSKEFKKNETELLILVTPHLAKPLVPAEIQLPTDYVVEPSAFGWYLQGSL
jgi:pilus assembly protein CpaC